MLKYFGQQFEIQDISYKNVIFSKTYKLKLNM